MDTPHPKEATKATASKHVESSARDASDNEKGYEGSSSSSISEGLNFRGFTKEEMKTLNTMMAKRVGKAIKKSMPYYINKTTENLQKIFQEEIGKLKKSGELMNDANARPGVEKEKSTYRDFTACAPPIFTGSLDPLKSSRWITDIEEAFRTSRCAEEDKVNFATNYLRERAKIWWEGKANEKDSAWREACTWEQFKEVFTKEYAPAEEIDKIREAFHNLMQTNESVNELWEKFCDMVQYCPEYRDNEKLKVDKFQRMLKDEIRTIVSPFKCTTMEDLLSRARTREADLDRMKGKEKKKLKRKQEQPTPFSKRGKFDFTRRDNTGKLPPPCNRCGKKHMGECKSGMKGCFKCGDPSHISKNCTKPLVICYGCNEEGHKLSECPKVNPRQAKPSNFVKEEKVVVSKPKARVYQMCVEEAKSSSDVIIGIILVKSKPTRVLYDSGASMSFVSYSFSKELSTPLEKLPTRVEVEIADSKIVVVSNVYRNV
ncbi:zinc finger, CCHC-type, Retrotransposon gag domain protein [Artemisia annua]|uniref:Zinc finger, CCHC-type, Retrotransposon gag domain protein n=1 Tax=Artemisia annua TaxID=35608 RepID=A0A2U1LF44_ARTAN|nr:zinc finger, CCHC-type, Retrotransposon gag domain protein [Artemisia annua]